MMRYYQSLWALPALAGAAMYGVWMYSAGAFLLEAHARQASRKVKKGWR